MGMSPAATLRHIPDGDSDSRRSRAGSTGFPPPVWLSCLDSGPLHTVYIYIYICVLHIQHTKCLDTVSCAVYSYSALNCHCVSLICRYKLTKLKNPVLSRAMSQRFYPLVMCGAILPVKTQEDNLLVLCQNGK